MRTLYLGLSALALSAISTVASADEGGWQLHGFADVSVKNDYVTPRGLVVTTEGGTIQAVEGLVAVSPGGIAFHAGTWVDFNPGYSKADGNIRAFNEFDWFAGVDYDIVKNLNVGVEYSEFISGQPSVAFAPEHNIEFSIKYKDGGGKAFAVNPYAKLFWAYSSRSSTVVTGKAGKTYDVELGIVPTYKFKSFTLSAPTWITVGPKSYWGFAKDPDNFGVVSTGLKLSTPVSNGPVHVGAYMFTQYYHLINDNLVLAKQILNSGDSKRDHVTFGGGLSFGF